MKIRKPVVAGYFYPETKRALIAEINKYISPQQKEKQTIISAISPHAGYIYSGKTAGKVYSNVKSPDTAIIIGPNHHGYGEPYAVDTNDFWETPLGKVSINKEIAQNILDKSKYLQEDSVAHMQEHSIEVQLPFLQFINPDIKIVPIVISSYHDSNPWYEIGYIIGNILQQSKKELIIIASSDFTHYEPAQQAKQKDMYAIEAIIDLDADEFLKRISENNITICGFAPIVSAIIASRAAGAKRAVLIDYSNSGKVSGDMQEVVGYAGIIVPQTTNIE